eukprot:scaffold110109_cov36-Tisochrysis_lutea.AAC.2
MERGRSLAVMRPRVRSRIKEQAHDFHISCIRSPMQGSVSLFVNFVHGCARLQVRLTRIRVSATIRETEPGPPIVPMASDKASGSSGSPSPARLSSLSSSNEPRGLACRLEVDCSFEQEAALAESSLLTTAMYSFAASTSLVPRKRSHACHLARAARSITDEDKAGASPTVACLYSAYNCSCVTVGRVSSAARMALAAARNSEDVSKLRDWKCMESVTVCCTRHGTTTAVHARRACASRRQGLSGDGCAAMLAAGRRQLPLSYG